MELPMDVQEAIAWFADRHRPTIVAHYRNNLTRLTRSRRRWLFVGGGRCALETAVASGFGLNEYS
jgi:hypothetical protein